MVAMASMTPTYRQLVVFVSGVFLLSNLLFAPALDPALGLLVIVGSLGSLAIIARTTRDPIGGIFAQRIDPRTLALCWITAVGLCVLGGEGHFFFANYDWLTRDAVLADLVQQKLPVSYDYQGQAFILRAPLGMYMIPSVFGKLFGLAAAHVALLIQNSTILMATLALLLSAAPERKFVFLAVFIAFSGIEIVGSFLLADTPFGASAWPPHAHQHLARWHPWFQYTNHVAQIFWVPNHALPGWWLAALSILYLRRQIHGALPVLSIAFLLFWSPLSVAGAIPIIAYVTCRGGIGRAVTPPMLAALVAGLCFIPIAAYLLVDAQSVPHQWLFFLDGFWIVYGLFIVVQIPHAAIVAAFWSRLDAGSKALSVLSITLLLLIPMYRLGMNGDFAMRASIAPLALLAFVFASIVAEMQWRDGILRISAVTAILVLASVTPVLEIQRAFAFHAFAVSNCNLLTTWSQLEPFRWWASYLARGDKVPEWLFRRESASAPAVAEDRQCWIDHPFHNSPTTAWMERD